MTFDIDKSGILDNTALTFGMYKGKTPTQLFDSEDKKAIGWLRWAFETVGNREICSEAMYRACGGKGKRAVKEDSNRTWAKKPVSSGKDAAGNQGENDKPLYGRRAGPMIFDDMDDDIPF